MEDLRKYGLKVYFSLKNYVDISQISVQAILKLFGTLIISLVFSFGCQIWFHKTAFANQVTNETFESSPNNCITRIAVDSIERLHLRFLRWTLRVHKKALNVFCWGDTGRCPLLQKIAKQTVDYFERLEGMFLVNCNQLTRHAFEDQRRLALPWFKKMSEVIGQCASRKSISQQCCGPYATHSGHMVKLQLKEIFKNLWAKVFY